jgi:hypothetical protein
LRLIQRDSKDYLAAGKPQATQANSFVVAGGAARASSRAVV